MRLQQDIETRAWFEAGDFGFDWDRGNETKSLTKHGVSRGDVEYLAKLGEPMFVGEIVESERNERRWLALGMDGNGRKLALIFTRRGEGLGLLRHVSCRPMRRGERRLYGDD